MKKVILMATAFAALTGCVPGRIHDELKAKYTDCTTENAKLKTDNSLLTTDKNECEEDAKKAKKITNELVRDTTMMGNSLRKITNNYDQLNKTYDLLLAKNKELLDDNERDTKTLTGQLFTSQKDLQDKEDKLKKLEKELDDKKVNLDKMQGDLAEQQKKLDQLQSILDKKDSTVNSLKRTVTDALTGFNNNGLTVEMRNGKVYVSMDESLLFASGSTKIDAKGAEAIKKLAKVLEENTDINVMVEGHTDDVPMRGSGDIKDNWDLSVMRASTVTKLLVSSAKVDPLRITASGHGEFMPLATGKTPEARKKNRRTEIILTPKLDELFRVIENN
jgi:chemotaxis protein MotB